MTKHSPHLPPPACSVGTHYKLQSLWKVLFIIFLAFLSGLTATFVAVAWVVPTVQSTQVLQALDRNGRRTDSGTPDPLFAQQTRQRVLTVYDKRKKVADAFYSRDAILGQAAILSSDGWTAVYDPDNALPDTSVWDGVDYQGITHRVKRVVREPFSHIVYAQFEGEGFRIMSFADWSAVRPDATLWAVSGSEWRQVYVGASVQVRQTPNSLLWQTQYQHSILPGVAKKSILMNTEGALVGFASDNGLVTNGWLMDYQLGTLLDHGTIGYRAVSWKGFFVSQQVGDNAGADQQGFYVVSGAPKSGVNVQIGDVVKSINGQTIDEVNAARIVLSAPDEFDATIVRSGAEMKVRVQKVVVTP